MPRAGEHTLVWEVTVDDVRHYEDRDRKFNGSEGRWTVCGKPWQRPAVDVKECRRCRALLSQLADQMRQGER